MNDTSLVPVIQITQPCVTKTIELKFKFDTMDDGTNHAMFNQVTYNPPLVPAIFFKLTLGENATVESVYGPLSFVIEHMDVVDIVVKNRDPGKHPLYVFVYNRGDVRKHELTMTLTATYTGTKL